MGVVVDWVVVVGLGVVMGILLGVEVVVATRMGILELNPLLSAPAPTERSEWRPGPGGAFWVQNSELEWTEGCWRYQGGSGLKKKCFLKEVCSFNRIWTLEGHF